MSSYSEWGFVWRIVWLRWWHFKIEHIKQRFQRTIIDYIEVLALYPMVYLITVASSSEGFWISYGNLLSLYEV